ncbi:MAG: peptidylprolyl isomerase [Nitrincola lacisaponensis]|uniref:Peptidyl-prolyl cis-trans isomerase n=1 Tax=Nitrincola lacisaponensis TaxID=267850 RepID=A0A063Y2V5_9GAMM|nr:peptidylprolyl isomerase [Nitrincola lacisaponensis]KDE39106.1 FKBP-type peptidyl-prolyl cis-trans isomerase SlyD [Nitrincola lacisaponensis]
MTQVQDDSVVGFLYKLQNVEGEVLETNEGGTPMVYLHGHDNMIPGLEQAMTGKQVGDKFEVTLAPSEAYGEREASMEMKVPVKHLQGLPKGVRDWKTGMVALVQTDQGPRHVTVIKPGRFMVLVDTNHPLAGQTLTYQIEIVSLRAAEAEEIAHGHVHGPGGHHH